VSLVFTCVYQLVCPVNLHSYIVRSYQLAYVHYILVYVHPCWLLMLVVALAVVMIYLMLHADHVQNLCEFTFSVWYYYMSVLIT
jgi:hypothetical protein